MAHKNDPTPKPLELRRRLGRTGHHIPKGVQSAPIGSTDPEAMRRMVRAITTKPAPPAKGSEDD
jgi:hypothetical protein